MPLSTLFNKPPTTSKPLTYQQVEEYWIAAGGNVQAAQMAAAIADAASGLNPHATGTDTNGNPVVGLWLIQKNGSLRGSTDPTANARAAIQQSQNGTDWSSWCIAWSDNSCGTAGGTYLGEGSNALDLLGQQPQDTTYQVAGSAPAGNGVGASSVTSTSTTTGQSTTSNSHSVLLIGALVAVVLVIYFVMQRRQPTPTESSSMNEPA